MHFSKIKIEKFELSRREMNFFNLRYKRHLFKIIVVVASLEFHQRFSAKVIAN